MSFQNIIGFSHDSAHPLGVLLINLGTPDAPTKTAVRRYLTEFLADRRVIEAPRLIWWLILHGFILRVRPARSAKAYQSVWTEQGSPLLTISRHQAAGLQERLEKRLTGAAVVELGMRYGNPSISAALQTLREANIRRLLVLPLYPQYSGTTTGSTFDAVTRALATWRWLPEVRFVNQYHDEPAYIDALIDSVRAFWREHGEPKRLLFSFHGIPKDYFLNGDPYHCHCHKTARLVSEGLGLPRDRWQLTFQSRVGNKEWLKPYTDETLKEWGAEGLESVHVICPGFASDCLETIEEIGEENRKYFLEAGGKDYRYIPCLNDSASHLEMLADLVQRHCLGWPESPLGATGLLAQGAA